MSNTQSEVNVTEGSVVNVDSNTSTRGCTGAGVAFWLMVGALIFGAGVFCGRQGYRQDLFELSQFFKTMCCVEGEKPVEPTPRPTPVPRPIRPGLPHGTPAVESGPLPE